MLKIAFIDHHLNNFHANTFLNLLRGSAVEGPVEIAAWEIEQTGEDWCEKNAVRRAKTPAEAVEGADGVLVLAPDNVEAHPALADAVLPLGKPTFLDKMLAPTITEAKQIVAAARRHNTPIFSASALRYAVELEAALPELTAAPIRELSARGMGAWNGYGIHTLSLATRLLGADIRRLIDTGTPTARTVTLDYGDGRRAVIDVRSAANEWDMFPWSFAARVGDRYIGAQITDFGGFYANLMRAVVAFFRTGTAEMPIEEALALVAVLEGANRSQEADGEWLPLPEA